MIHYFIFAIIFILALAFNYWNYSKNYDKLAVFHSLSITIDILVWIGAGSTLVIAFIILEKLPEYWPLIWITILFATASSTIHVARFIIGMTKKRKSH